MRQIAGYLLSGERAYITGFKEARALIGAVERDRIMEELVRACVATLEDDAVPPFSGDGVIRAGTHGWNKARGQGRPRELG